MSSKKTEQPKVILEKSALLDKYYDKRTRSSLPNGYEPYFQFGKLDWGYDLIEEIDGKPSVMPIPPGKTTLAGVFFESDAVYNYMNGQIIIISSIPAGAIPVNESHIMSAIGIKDAQGDYIAISVTQPTWVYSERGMTIEIVINTAMNADKASMAVLS